jgi:4'-phosphopantetheinyl transferase
MTTISTFEISKLLQSEKDFNEIFSKVLPESTVMRAGKITNRKNRLLSLSGELLARHLLFKTFGHSVTEMEFSYAEKGKPYLPGRNDVHFNISHSGNMVAAAVAHTRIGIDIEHFRKINFQIAERFFTPAELFYIHTQEEPEKTRNFFEIWTIKESFLKAIGTGLTRSLSSFEVTNNAGKFLISGNGSENFGVNAYHLKDYQLAVCVEHDIIPKTVSEVAFDDLFATTTG